MYTTLYYSVDATQERKDAKIHSARDTVEQIFAAFPAILDFSSLRQPQLVIGT